MNILCIRHRRIKLQRTVGGNIRHIFSGKHISSRLDDGLSLNMLFWFHAVSLGHWGDIYIYILDIYIYIRYIYTYILYIIYIRILSLYIYHITIFRIICIQHIHLIDIIWWQFHSGVPQRQIQAFYAPGKEALAKTNPALHGRRVCFGLMRERIHICNDM